MAEETWRFPAPADLRFTSITDHGYHLEWEAVRGPHGQQPSGYTVKTWQLDGIEVDEFTTRGTSTDEYGRGGRGLHPGWTYRTEVWANGGPEGPPHAQLRVTLRPPAQASATPGPARGGVPGPPVSSVPVPPVAPAPSSVTPGVAAAAAAAARTAAAASPGQPRVWQPWSRTVTAAEQRMRVEIADATRELGRRMGEAGKLLDESATAAAEATGHLEAAAWRAWKAYMGAAVQARQGILGTAYQQYDATVAQAVADYNAALDAAQSAYTGEIMAANRASSIASQMTTGAAPATAAPAAPSSTAQVASGLLT